ncbi:MAG: hypothetical protein LBD53_03135 [Tannerella sp.]|jgi:predicted metal-dependent phosphoesterase TrpH|nr:hypothetical protein [Tannerella sp.]
MSDRRDFLRKTVMLGAGAAVVSRTELFGKEPELQQKKKITPEPLTGNTYPVEMGYIRAPARTPRKINIPDVEGYKALKGDFHIHTLFSDGHVMPYHRVRDAVDNGLDVISITDHFEYRPYFSQKGKWKLIDETGFNFNIWYDIGKAEADKAGLLLVRGGEITKSVMPPGHFNALFTTDNNAIFAAVDNWRDMLRVAHEQGAFLLWNHPGWEAPKSGGIEKGAPLVFTKEHEEAWKNGWLNGIEIFNSTSYYPVVSDWANERDLALFANSDIHATELEHYGLQNPLRPINILLCKDRTVESVKDAMFGKRMIAWAANTLWGRDPWMPTLFKACVSIKTISPGTLSLKNTSSLPINVTLGGVSFDLPENIERQVYIAEGVKQMTVTNWMMAMNKPLIVQV